MIRVGPQPVYVFADTGTYILSTPVLGEPVLARSAEGAGRRRG